MNEITRRRALLATGSVGTLALAGCLDDGTAADGTSNGDDREDPDAAVVSHDVFQLGASASQPAWADGSAETPGFVAVVDSERDFWMLEDMDGLEEWLDGTDFDDSLVVYVETAGPNTCYDEVAVGDVRVTADPTDDWDGGPVIAGTVDAVDTSDGMEACGEAVTYPSALIRVTGDDLPTDAAFTITDGWGETGFVHTIDGAIDPDALPGYVRPSHDPQTVPDTLECDDDGFQRHRSPVNDVAWGEVHDEDGDPMLAMRVRNPQYDGDDATRALEFERGDEVRVSMRNVADETVDTGNANKFGLEVFTADGWMDVRGTTDDAAVGYTDETLVHSPGEGVEWSFELTEDGLLVDHAHEDRLEVCPGLPEGRYRFVFWGVIGDESLAVAFDYFD